MERSRQQAGDLLRLAVADPRRAEAEIADVVVAATDPWVLSVVAQARGLVLRERGEVSLAVRELRTAAAMAGRSLDPDRVSDVRATLGATLVMDGRTRQGQAQLALAIEAARDPLTRATVLMRRAYVLSFVLGRHRDAIADLRQALAEMPATDEEIREEIRGEARGEVWGAVWGARTWNILGTVLLAVGEVTAAEEALVRAERTFSRAGHGFEALVATHNRGLAAYSRGDLPRCLAVFDLAAAGYAGFGVDPVELTLDRCTALLAAGLPGEAAQLATAALSADTVLATRRPELQLSLASARLAQGDPAGALPMARTARTTFRRQGREWWALRSELLILRAGHPGGRPGHRLVDRAAEVARLLEASGSDEAPTAWLVAGRMAADAGAASTSRLLGKAARHRHQGAGLTRATGWLAAGLARDSASDTRGVLAACRRGLDALDEHRFTLGSSELRAQAARHGEELAVLGLRHALRGRPRSTLWWSERWRAIALSQPPVRPPGDDRLSSVLAALRDNRRRLEVARAEGSPVEVLIQERDRLEAEVRGRGRHASGSAGAQPDFDVEELVEAVGDATLLELLEIDGRLHALVVSSGRVRRFALGTAPEAQRAAEFARFALRQSARGRPAALADVGARLQAAVLGSAAAAAAVTGSTAGPVIVCPTSRLNAAPWTLMPALAGVPVTVTPSAALWLRARSRSPLSTRRVIIAGPQLVTGGAEVPVLARSDPSAVVLRDGAATVARALRAIDGAELAHIAAHGHFRADSPMFSALDLDDGPLTVHDFELLERAPHRMVLSACESGVLAPVGSAELLGLTSTLLALGTAGIVSSVAEVNDEATAELMVGVHRRLDQGDDLGRAMLHARDAARGDPLRAATAAAFAAIGV